jgi:hypothetical protein
MEREGGGGGGGLKIGQMFSNVFLYNYLSHPRLSTISSISICCDLFVSFYFLLFVFVFVAT